MVFWVFSPDILFLCCLAYYIEKKLFMQEIVHALFSFLLLYGQENKMNTHSQSHDKVIEGQVGYVSCIQDEVFLIFLLVSCHNNKQL